MPLSTYSSYGHSSCCQHSRKASAIEWNTFGHSEIWTHCHFTVWLCLQKINVVASRHLSLMCHINNGNAFKLDDWCVTSLMATMMCHIIVHMRWCDTSATTMLMWHINKCNNDVAHQQVHQWCATSPQALMMHIQIYIFMQLLAVKLSVS